MQEELQNCSHEHHHENVENLTTTMPDEGTLCDLAEFF